MKDRILRVCWWLRSGGACCANSSENWDIPNICLLLGKFEARYALLGDWSAMRKTFYKLSVFVRLMIFEGSSKVN